MTPNSLKTGVNTGCGREAGDYKILYLGKYSVWINYYCLFNRPFLCRTCITPETSFLTNVLQKMGMSNVILSLMN